MKHLARHLHDVTYAVTDVWCEGFGLRGAAEDPADADCVPCLRAAIDYGYAACARLRDLRPRPASESEFMVKVKAEADRMLADPEIRAGLERGLFASLAASLKRDEENDR